MTELKKNKRKTDNHHEAAIPNPALNPFNELIGEWETEGTHPYVPDTIFHGRSSFDWIEGGAFVIMHSEIDEPGIPSSIAIFGSDDSTGEYYKLYFDERKVSRKYKVSFEGNTMKWWRDSHSFSQKMTLTLAENGNTISSKGEMSKDGGNWEKNLELTYRRVNLKE
jgi:hypothetical protein